MRWQHIIRGAPAYGPAAVTILSTPLYSNTTMASFMPTVGSGGQVVLMKKFDARGFLELAERESATNTMLVPGQYRRIRSEERHVGKECVSTCRSRRSPTQSQKHKI